MTYLLISAPFLLIAALVWLWRLQYHARQVPVTALVLVTVTVLTIVFDNLMIYYGNVDYGEEHNLGIFLGVMPIEDLFYPLFATLVLTAFWPLRRHGSAERRFTAARSGALEGRS